MDAVMNPYSKLECLRTSLTEMASVLVAYSGGVDSTLLLKIASDVLADKALAVTAISPTYPARELVDAQKNALDLGARHLLLNTAELEESDFYSNTPNRCYYCKRELFSKLAQLAKQYGLNYVIDGSNWDDQSDFRPGMRAASEFNVRSPLKEAKLTKEEIRALSKELNLPTWDKPAFPCLSTRFPYGTRITREKVNRVAMAEEFLVGLGIRQFRVRDHGDIARIEVLKADIPMIIEDNVSQQITQALRNLGYTYVALDLQGYRMGSMNEPLAVGARCNVPLQQDRRSPRHPPYADSSR